MKKYNQKKVDENEATHRIVGGPYGSAYCDVCKYGEFTCWEDTCEHLQKTSIYRVIKIGPKGKIVVKGDLTAQAATKYVSKLKSKDHIYYEVQEHMKDDGTQVRWAL